MNFNIKTCTICNSKKDLNLFYSYFSKSRNKIRYDSKCKECKKAENRIRVKKYYEEHKAKRLIYAANYREKHKEKIKEDRKRFKKKYIENLQDCYVNEQICRILKVKGFKPPAEITEAYKLNILIKRKLKDGKK